MRYETVRVDPAYTLLARWVNQHNIFHTHTFGQFIELTSSGKYRTDKIPKELKGAIYAGSYKQCNGG